MNWTLLFCTRVFFQLLSVAVLSLLYACDVSNASKAVKAGVFTPNMIFRQTDESDRSILIGDEEESRYSKRQCSYATGNIIVSTLSMFEFGRLCNQTRVLRYHARQQ